MLPCSAVFKPVVRSLFISLYGLTSTRLLLCFLFIPPLGLSPCVYSSLSLSLPLYLSLSVSFFLCLVLFLSLSLSLLLPLSLSPSPSVSPSVSSSISVSPSPSVSPPVSPRRVQLVLSGSRRHSSTKSPWRSSSQKSYRLLTCSQGS